MSGLRILLALAIAGSSAVPSLAGKPDYCAAYARDFADARTKDKPIWQHKYEIALAACMTEPKKAEVIKPVPAKKVVAKAKVEVIIPPEPVAEPPKVETPPFKNVKASKTAKMEQGSAAWNDYCANKYSSFDIKKGTYTSRTGVERKCLVTAN
jgi:BA14K-like protein